MMAAQLRGLRLGYASVTPESRAVTRVTRKQSFQLSHACARSTFHATNTHARIRESVNMRFPRNPSNCAGYRSNYRVT